MSKFKALMYVVWYIQFSANKIYHSIPVFVLALIHSNVYQHFPIYTNCQTNKTHHHYISIYPSLVTCHTVDGSHSCPALRPLQPDAVDRDCQPSEDATHYRLHLRGRDVLTTPPKRVSSSILRGVIQIDPY